MRSTGLTRIESLSDASPSSGCCSVARSAGERSIARKTRQRSPSASAMVTDLDGDLAGPAQRRLAVVDEFRKPRCSALRAVEVNRGREDQDDRQVDLVGAPLEHAGNGEAAIRLDDAADRAGGQGLYCGRQGWLRNFRRTQPAGVAAA